MRLERYDSTRAVQLLGSGERTPITVPVPSSVSPTVHLASHALRHTAQPFVAGRLSFVREISPAIALAYCRGMYYAVGGRNYFAVGFLNDAGGWELRSERFKGCVSPKHITIIDNRSDTVVTFEGFMDFLSYLSQEQTERLYIDAVVLNSVVYLPKAIPFLERHSTIHAFFDNDDAERKATAELKRLCPNSTVVDRSHLNREHKDPNEYWQAKQHQPHIASICKRGVKMKRGKFVFLSAKNSHHGSHPAGLTPNIELKHPKHTGGRPPLGKARKQEYRITLRLDTEHKLRLQALTRAAGRPRTKVFRQLIADGRVRERLLREHLDFMSQLKGVSHNLNQLTRLTHARGFASVRSRHAIIIASIESLLKHLRDDR